MIPAWLKTVLVILLFVFAFWLRIGGITWGLPSRSGTLASYHPDEPNVFLGLENMAKNRSLYAGREGFFAGTFFFYCSAVVLGIAKLAGCVHFGSRAFYLSNLKEADRLYIAVRCLSTAAVLAAGFILYRIVEKRYGFWLGFWAAFALLFSPVVEVVSLQTKVDGMLLLLLVLYAGKIWDFCESGSRKDILLAGIWVGLAASTRYTGGIMCVAIPVAIFFRARQYFWRWLLLSGLVALVFFLAGTPYIVLRHKVFLDTLRFQFLNFSNPKLKTVTPNGFWEYFSYLLPFAIGWPVWILSLIGCAVAIVKGNLVERISAFGLVFGFSFLAVADSHWSYYTLIYYPFLFHLSALGLRFIWTKQ